MRHLKTFVAKFLIWFIVFWITTFIVSLLLGATLLKGYSNPSFYIFLIPLIALSIANSSLTLLFFLFLQRRLKKLRFEKLLVGLLFFGSFVYSFIFLAEAYDVLSLIFKPLPTISNAVDAQYEYNDSGGPMPLPVTEFKFQWKENLSADERISSLEDAVKLYENFTMENSWHFSHGQAEVLINSTTMWREFFAQGSCEEVFKKGRSNFYSIGPHEYERTRNLLISCSFDDEQGSGMFFFSNLTSVGLMLD
jgi:hypothetical protein